MFSKLLILRGLHPGFFLDRELRKRGLKKGSFALSIGEYPQTLGAIMLGKRNMNPSMALKIESALSWEEGFLMCLQALYDMRAIAQKKPTEKPDLSQIRPILFWDTDLEKINWQKSKAAILKRLRERGNEREKIELQRVYKIKL
jgi:plasmid maintenance system antidote protein VapI